MTFNIYVASYHRSNETKVYRLLEYCTYVVRQSEETLYRAEGINNIWAIPDEKICSFSKVQNYIIENAPEDIVCVLDDDIKEFGYCIEDYVPIKDASIATAELERVGQLLADLGLGLAGSRVMICIPYGYACEFSLSAMVGPVRYYAKGKTKARYIEEKFFSDTDFVLQELLENRIILRPCYFGGNALIETNKGGMNTERNRKAQIECFDKVIKPKWGKYVRYQKKKNITVIAVKR